MKAWVWRGYGARGMGKTHLLQSIANRCQTRAVYLTAEEFVKEYVSVVEANGEGSFQNKYCKPDILIIDDLQYLAGKSASQHVLTNICSERWNSGRQIVFASDYPVRDLHGFHEKLTSLLKGCVCAEISKPPFETRKKILDAACKSENLELDEECLNFLASSVTESVRDLKSCISRLAFQKSLGLKKISLSSLKKLIADLLDTYEEKCVGMVIPIFFEKENINTGTMNSEFLLSIFSSFAEEESRSISTNVKWAMRSRFEDGSFKQGMPPFG